MDQSPTRQRTPRRSKEQIFELLAAYDKTTGMTVKDFCKLHKVTEGSFYTARKRQRGSVTRKQSSGFIPITRPAFDQQAPVLFAEVKGIKLYQPVPVDYLKALIG